MLSVDLVLGTLTLRPYVFVFLGLFLAAGRADLGWRRTARFGAVVWPIAWLAEFASTRIGIPFGLYHYTGLTRGQELYIADVPFMDALSFTFLAYGAFCLARLALRGRAAGRGALSLAAGVLMMALDVVIDPLAVLGDRWFLGRLFYYPEGGAYFGVPLSNFAGWVIVGAAGVAAYLSGAGAVRPVPLGAGVASPALTVARSARPRSAEGGPRETRAASARPVSSAASSLGARVWPGVALYYGVLAFNLAITVWIGEWTLLAAGLALHAAIGATIWGVGRQPGAAPVFSSRGAWRA